MIELLKCGRKHSDVTVLEGILPAQEYHRLFETAVEEYGRNIFAYYCDLPFEETLRRHQTKPNRDDFGEADMRRWWKEKDFLPMISETVLGQELNLQDAVGMICRQVTESTNE